MRLRFLGVFVGLGMALAAGAPVAAPADLAFGARVYREQCAICHGEAGDGRGHAAHHFRTLPRDFTLGRYKIRSTASGQVPTDDDLRRTIVGGLPGTGMVRMDHLTDAELSAVIDHIKSLSPRFAVGPPRLLPIPAAPAPSADDVERGRKAYAKAECAECHGPEGRGDGPAALLLTVKPSDLTRRPFKGGATPRDIVRTLITGFDGTSMPSYEGVLDDDEVWSLAHWLDSIAGPPEMTRDERAGWHVVRMHQPRR
jgi:cytochrome c oxidase cbb3-type subunit 2